MLTRRRCVQVVLLLLATYWDLKSRFAESPFHESKMLAVAVRGAASRSHPPTQPPGDRCVLDARVPWLHGQIGHSYLAFIVAAGFAALSWFNYLSFSASHMLAAVTGTTLYIAFVSGQSVSQ